jgi:hypothetical protein
VKELVMDGNPDAIKTFHEVPYIRQTAARLYHIYESSPEEFLIAYRALVDYDVEVLRAFLDGAGIPKEKHEPISIEIGLEIAACLELKSLIEKNILWSVVPRNCLTVEWLDECVVSLFANISAPSGWPGLGPLTKYLGYVRMDNQAWWFGISTSGENALRHVYCRVDVNDDVLDALAEFLWRNRSLTGRN